MQFLERIPSKIVAVASNYRCHAEEMGKPIPGVPKLFFKPPSALCGPEDVIRLPGGVGRVDHEAELAVVIGKPACSVRIAEALDFVGGYTCLNDVTARVLQKEDGLFARAKGFDTFCPVGPTLSRRLDPSNLRISCRVNGVTRQDGNTSDLIFPVPVLISFISSIMKLEAGDIIATGTPLGVGALTPGDVVEVEVEGIGVLRNSVAAGEPAWTP